jgi:hypothetical protein
MIEEDEVDVINTEPEEEQSLDTEPRGPFIKPPFNPNEINLN